MAILQQDSDSALVPSLSERVDELICSYEDRPLSSTMGTHAAIAELAARTRGLEQAIRELALLVQDYNASH